MRKRLLIALPIFAVPRGRGLRRRGPARLHACESRFRGRRCRVPRRLPAGAAPATAAPTSPRPAGTPAASTSPTGAPSAYKVETTQQVRHLHDGWYTLRAWVRGSAGRERQLDRARLRPPATTRGSRCRCPPRRGCRSSSRRESSTAPARSCSRTDAAARRMGALRRRRARPRARRGCRSSAPTSRA